LNNSVILRTASTADAPALHRLIAENLEAGHLLPRTIEDRFTVADADGLVVGCAELAPLGESVAEVRSLVVHDDYRGRRIGSDLIHHLSSAANERGFSTLCAFTHEPSHFVRLGFSIVPHMWVPEKIAHDCTSCPLFRRCGQYAVALTLRAGVSVRPLQPAAVIYAGRVAGPRKPNVERLQIRAVDATRKRKEPVPA
jgi:amino-acid N-acetyltransferase